MDAKPPVALQYATLENGRDALAKGDWDTARAIFDALLRKDGPASPLILEGLSDAAWWQNDATAMFDARERAYHLYRESGDLLAAARMAIWLGGDYLDFRGEVAVSNGWLQLARRILEELPTAAEHGWMAVFQADIAIMLDDDTETAKRLAHEATAIGRQLRFIDIEVMGRTVEGLALVTEGDMTTGMSCLDEAAAEALSGDLKELFTINFVLCHLLFACERARDFDRASQWCRRTMDYADRLGFIWAQGTCRVHYAGVLLWRGMWAEAEKELAAASRYLTESRPPYECEARVRLAELRRRQGRPDEADALFREVDSHPLALLGLAEMALAAGEGRDAEEYLQRVLRTVPEKSIAQRAAALEALGRTYATSGEHGRAKEAQTQFDAIVDTLGTQPMRAASRFLAGSLAVAEGHDEEARGHFEDAIQMFERCSAPYEAAKTRLELANVFTRQSRPERAGREAKLALETLQSLGARADAAAAARLLDDAERDGASDRGVLTKRQIEVMELVARGMSDREIAAALVMSDHTVHRHVANILQRLGLPSRAAAVAECSRLGLL